MILTKRGFTLVELLVVMGMIAVILGAMVTSVSGAQTRARIQKATSDVKVVTQAILSFENYERNHELPTRDDKECTAESDSLGFLFGKETTKNGYQVPTLLMASLQKGAMRDPWGTPYTVTIKKKPMATRFRIGGGTMRTGGFLPNFYRLGADERCLVPDDEKSGGAK